MQFDRNAVSACTSANFNGCALAAQLSSAAAALSRRLTPLQHHLRFRAVGELVGQVVATRRGCSPSAARAG